MAARLPECSEAIRGLCGANASEMIKVDASGGGANTVRARFRSRTKKSIPAATWHDRADEYVRCICCPVHMIPFLSCLQSETIPYTVPQEIQGGKRFFSCVRRFFEKSGAAGLKKTASRVILIEQGRFLRQGSGAPLFPCARERSRALPQWRLRLPPDRNARKDDVLK